MPTILGQRVASTHADIGGERLTLEFLDRYATAMAGKRQPLNSQHDLTQRTVGYFENLRVEPDLDSSGDYFLVADVHIDDSSSLEHFGGFSISGVEMIREPLNADAQMLLAYPLYKDDELLASLSSDSRLALGKWIKKAAGEFEWGVLVGSLVVLVLTPIWDDVYKRKIAPRVDELVDSYLKKLHPKGVGAELVQVVEFNGSDIQVRFIPIRGKEAVCLGSEAIGAGLERVASFLSCDIKASSLGVSSIVLFYDGGKDTYELHRVEYADGSVEHAA